ncbi:MAG: DUF4097 family beta strand repeat protein [Ignavibacteria bacterium]|nr:DUF4097 family beta strand repeat protein [Ignavibacteria bacterium]
MASRITIVLTDEDGVPLPDQTVELRKGPSFSVREYEMVDVVGKPGAYQTEETVDTGVYKLWVNGSEDTSFGGSAGREITEQDDLVLKITDESGTYWECKGLEFRSAGVTTEANSLIRKSEADDRYLKLEGGTMAGSIEMAGNIITGLTSDADPSSAMTREDIEAADQIVRDDMTELIEAIESTPFQESPNVIRLIPGGTAKTGQVYITYSSAVQYAKSVRASTRKMCIKIEGMGTSNTFIQISDGGISGQGYFENYISMVGLHEGITLKLPDSTVSFGTAGTATIENITFLDTDGDSNNTFANVSFKNCKFNLAGEVTFSGCTFSGVNIIKTAGTQTFTSCKGGTVYSTEAIPSTVQGVGEIPSADLF